MPAPEPRQWRPARFGSVHVGAPGLGVGDAVSVHTVTEFPAVSVVLPLLSVVALASVFR